MSRHSYYRTTGAGYGGSSALLDDMISIHLARYEESLANATKDTQSPSARHSQSVTRNVETPEPEARTKANPCSPYFVRPKEKDDQKLIEDTQTNTNIDQLTAAISQMSVGAKGGSSNNGVKDLSPPKTTQPNNQKAKQNSVPKNPAPVPSRPASQNKPKVARQNNTSGSTSTGAPAPASANPNDATTKKKRRSRGKKKKVNPAPSAVATAPAS